MYQCKISRSKPGSIAIEVSNLCKCHSANSPIDRVIGVDGIYHHMLLHVIYLLFKKLQNVLNFGQNVSWKLLEIYWKSYLTPCCFTCVAWVVHKIHNAYGNLATKNRKWNLFADCIIMPSVSWFPCRGNFQELQLADVLFNRSWVYVRNVSVETMFVEFAWNEYGSV